MSKIINSTKYFVLLSSLNRKEKDALLQFSLVEKFNPSKKIHLLITHTAKVNPIINKKELYTLIFYESKFDDRKLRNLLSRAYVFVQKYISVQFLIDNELKYYDLTYEALANRKEEKFIDEKLTNWNKELTKFESLEDAFIKQKMKFNDVDFHRRIKKLSNSNRNFKISNQQYNEALDEYFILKKIKLFITSFNYQSFVDVEEKFTLLDEIIAFVQKKENRSLVLEVYYNLLMILYNEANNQNYYNLKKIFPEINKNFDEIEKREIYLLIQNYTIKRINKGNSEFLEELFKLFKTMLENETIYENGKLSQWSYKNIVTVALRLNEFEYCEYFLDHYKNRLDKKYREEAYSLNKANYYLHVKEFLRALPLLQTINFSDILSLVSSKVLQLKIFYELNDFDTLISTIESFDKILIRNKKLSSQYKLRFKNFNKYLKKLIKLKSKKDKISLRKKLTEEKIIDNKTWLLNKIDNFK